MSSLRISTISQSYRNDTKSVLIYFVSAYGAKIVALCLGSATKSSNTSPPTVPTSSALKRLMGFSAPVDFRPTNANAGALPKANEPWKGHAYEGSCRRRDQWCLGRPARSSARAAPRRRRDVCRPRDARDLRTRLDWVVRSERCRHLHSLTCLQHNTRRRQEAQTAS